MTTVPCKDWPKQEDWPKAGWKHALNYQRFHKGDVFGWSEEVAGKNYMWSGIVEETTTCSVKVKDVLPGAMS